MVYVINLDGALRRRNAMVEELQNAGCSGIFFKAVDGRKLTSDQILQMMDSARAFSKYRILTGGELGCALSHIGVWSDLLRSKEHTAIVLEDDVKLSSDFSSTITALNERYAMESTPMLVLLGKADVCYRQELPVNHAIVLHQVKFARGAYGYWVNRSGAECLKRFLDPVWTEIDNWPLVMKETELKIYCLNQAVAGLSQENNSSTIGNERNQLEYNRIYRGNLLQRILLRLYHSIRWRIVALIELIDPRIMRKGNHAYEIHG